MSNVELTVAGLAIVVQVVATIALLALCYLLAQRFVAWVARACRAAVRLWRVAAARRSRRRKTAGARYVAERHFEHETGISWDAYVRAANERERAS